ncbi:MAG: hypothetical protein EXS51_01205 [Candidatus Taylorbacteria bacterium]|nr:hypothetical protein [Candidatus Taylorbacteria bacterium]
MNLRISSLALFWAGVLMFGVIILLGGLAETVNNSVFDTFFAVLVASGILSLLASFVQAWRSKDNRILLSLALLGVLVDVIFIAVAFSGVAGEATLMIFFLALPISVLTTLFFLILYLLARRRVAKTVPTEATSAPLSLDEAVNSGQARPTGHGLGMKVLVIVFISGLVALILAFVFRELPFVEGYSNLFLLRLTPLFAGMVIAFHYLKRGVSPLVRGASAICLVLLFALAGYLFYTFQVRWNEFKAGIPYTPQLPASMSTNISTNTDVLSVKGLLPVEGAPVDDLERWKTYRNERYGFAIQYPSRGWEVTMRGNGEAVRATTQAEVFTITTTDGTEDSVAFDIATLGSDRLGSYYASAKNVSDYLKLIPATDQNGRTLRKFIQMITVDGQEAYWYQTYVWAVAKQKYVWSSKVYWQHGNDIYEVSISDPLANAVSSQILSTFKFTK